MEHLAVDGSTGDAITVGPGISYYWPDINRSVFMMMNILHQLLVMVGIHRREEPVSSLKINITLAIILGCSLAIFCILFHRCLVVLGL